MSVYETVEIIRIYTAVQVPLFAPEWFIISMCCTKLTLNA